MIRFIHDFSENLAGQLLYPMGLVGISVSLQVQDCNEPFSLECFKETAGFTITLMHFNISYNEMNNSGPKVSRKPHTVSTSPCGACTHQLHLPGTQLNPATTAHAAHYQNQNPWGRGPLCGGSWVWISAQNTPRFHHWLSSFFKIALEHTSVPSELHQLEKPPLLLTFYWPFKAWTYFSAYYILLIRTSYL